MVDFFITQETLLTDVTPGKAETVKRSSRQFRDNMCLAHRIPHTLLVLETGINTLNQ